MASMRSSNERLQGTRQKRRAPEARRLGGLKERWWWIYCPKYCSS